MGEEAAGITRSLVNIDDHDMDNALNDAQSENTAVPQKLDQPDEGLSTLVVQGLTRYRDRDEIIADVCKCTGWHWKKAEEYLREIEEEHTPAIAGVQARLILPLGIGIMLAGVAQVIIALVLMYNFIVDWFAQPGALLGEEVYITYMLDAIVVMLQIAPHLGFLLLSGIAFCFGGAFGMIRVVNRMRGEY